MDHAIFNPSNYYINSNAIAPVTVVPIVFGTCVYSFFKINGGYTCHL